MTDLPAEILNDERNPIEAIKSIGQAKIALSNKKTFNSKSISLNVENTWTSVRLDHNVIKKIIGAFKTWLYR